MLPLVVQAIIIWTASAICSLQTTERYSRNAAWIIVGRILCLKTNGCRAHSEWKTILRTAHKVLHHLALDSLPCLLPSLCLCPAFLSSIRGNFYALFLGTLCLRFSFFSRHQMIHSLSSHKSMLKIHIFRGDPYITVSEIEIWYPLSLYPAFFLFLAYFYHLRGYPTVAMHIYTYLYIYKYTTCIYVVYKYKNK